MGSPWGDRSSRRRINLRRRAAIRKHSKTSVRPRILRLRARRLEPYAQGGRRAAFGPAGVPRLCARCAVATSARTECG